jgi:hypothetical protein
MRRGTLSLTRRCTEINSTTITSTKAARTTAVCAASSGFRNSA